MKRTGIALIAAAIGMAAVGVASAATWAEVGDAPALLPGQQTQGTGVLDLITGNFTGYYDVDVYEIKIVDYTLFSASTVGLTTADTRLYLFNASGDGVTFDDDTAVPASAQSTLTSQFLTANGTYYLAVTRYNIIAAKTGAAPGSYIWNPNPYNTERAPDGAGAPGPLAQWFGAAMYADTNYGVDLKGAEFAVQEFPLGDMNCDGAINGQDIDGFILVLFGAPPYDSYYAWAGIVNPPCDAYLGDMNGDGVVNGQDIDGFVAVLFGG